MDKKKRRFRVSYLIFMAVLAIIISLTPIVKHSAKAASPYTISLNMYTYSEKQLYVNYAVRKGKWKSSNTKIATVSKYGMLTTKSKAGKTVISVKLDGITYKCNLTVKKDKYAIKISKSKVTLNGYDDSFQLKATTSSKKKIKFKCYGTNVAKVSSSGVITPVQDGQCSVIAYIDDKKNYRERECVVTVKGCPEPAAEKTKYSYELYAIDGLGNEGWFNIIERPIYIKTKNPDIKSINIRSDNFDLCAGACEISGYADLDYNNEIYNDRIMKVPGGYIANIIFTSSANQSAPSFDGYIIIRENERVAVNLKVTVHNPNYESKQAVKRIVNSISKDGMTPFDKMQAFVDYVESRHPKYYWNDGKYLYRFAEEPDDSLWFYHWKFDSLVTPTVLYQAAQEIGGFDEIKNLYYDGDWSEHWYAEVRIDNDTRRYTFCPFSESGYIENPTAKKLTFTNISKYPKIY